MLFEISKQQINQETVDTVSARELHKFLENGDAFANWIKNRIEKYGFVENQDYVSFLENTKKTYWRSSKYGLPYHLRYGKRIIDG